MNSAARSIYLKRLELGLTQKELAVKAGIPQPNISNIEKGRDFKISTLYQLAVALRVRPEDLLSGMEPFKIRKDKLFERDNIEKLAAYLAGSKTVLPKFMEPVALLLMSILGESQKAYIRKKDVHLDWAKLKTVFSNEEINAILSRVDKAKRRNL